MNIITLLLIVIAILVIIFFFTIIKHLIKIAIVVAVIALVIFIFTKGTINQDAANVKADIPEPKIILLEANGKILAGFADEKNLTLFENLDSINALYKDKKLKDLQSSYNQLIIYNLDYIPGVKINRKEVTKEEIIGLYMKDEDIASITFADLLLDIDIKNPDESNMNAALFAYIYEQELKMTRSPLEFFSSYKRGEMVVYPESIFFQAAKILPLSFMEENINKLKVSVAEKLP